MRTIAVIGGGISGLAAAHRLLELQEEERQPLLVQIFEASDRLGGVIETSHREGFLLEGGPDSLITEKPWALDLAGRLGLGERIVGTQEEHRRSFVARKERLHPTPEGFYLLAPSRLWPLAFTGIFSPLGKLRMGLDLVLPRRKDDGDESLGSFVRRRLGREALERMAQPMVGAIYGADPMRLSLQATFPRFQQMEREHGSVIRALAASIRKRRLATTATTHESAVTTGNHEGTGAQQEGGSSADREAGDAPKKQTGVSGARYGMFAALDGGLQVLVDALVQRLPEGSVRTGCVVEEIRRVKKGRWVVVAGGEELAFDAVIVALPGPRAAPVLRKLDEELGRRLSFVVYGSSSIVHAAYATNQVNHAMDGFGFVVPEIEGMSILGCTFVQRKYAGRVPEGQALLRAFHGSRSKELSDSALVEATLRDLAVLLNIRGEPRFTHVTRYPDSLPHYGVGHLDLIAEIESRMADYPGLELAGNAYRGIGVPDCVRSGEQAAEAVVRTGRQPAD